MLQIWPISPIETSSSPRRQKPIALSVSRLLLARQLGAGSPGSAEGRKRRRPVVRRPPQSPSVLGPPPTASSPRPCAPAHCAPSAPIPAASAAPGGSDSRLRSSPSVPPSPSSSLKVKAISKEASLFETSSSLAALASFSRIEVEPGGSPTDKATQNPSESMDTSAATPTRPPHPVAASPSPSSSSSLRLWRSAAQRNVRNQWSHLRTAKDQWLAAVADGRSHASALVNIHLSRRNMPATDLGVLKDMPGIRDKANSKLARREEQYSGMLLLAYKEMVRQLSYLVKASHSMRRFSKATPNCSIMQFSDCQDDLNDSGDGGGAPVFKWFSILEFESLAQELVEMFVSEQKLKRLLLLGFLSITLNEGVEHQTSLDWGEELYDSESNELQSIGLQSGDTYQLPENWSADILGSQRPGNTPSHEVLQVYLTTWHTNMNIKLSRIDEIFELVKEEMEIKLS